MSNLILASGSPRRKQLLSELGYQFEIRCSAVEESSDASLSLRQLCEHNARLKAQDIAADFPDRIVLGADTLVYLDNTPLGKPLSQQEARETLRMLSGKIHTVCTGLCLVCGERVKMFSEVTKVHFKCFDLSTIDLYLQRVEVMDKAGSYAIQECGEMLVDFIEGDFSNVVGLPQALVKKEIEAFGLKTKVK